MTRGKYEARHPAVLAFLKWLDNSPHLQHLAWYQRFRAVIELWFAAVRRDDPTYLKRVEELTPEAVRGGKVPRIMEQEGACTHFAKLRQAMMEEPQDLLGEAYQAYSVRDTRSLAQYFTPDSVAKCMAAMSVGDLPEDVFRKPGGCKLSEPACGSGVMMIHFLAEIHRKHGQWALNRTQVVMCDLDPLCVAMAGIQMAWMPWPMADVVLMQGDSLTQKQEVVWVLGKGVPPAYERIVVKPEVQP